MPVEVNPNAMKVSDTDPIVAVLSDARGPVNLAGATVEFSMSPAVAGIGHAAFSGTADVLQGVDSGGRITNKGKASYSWATGETDEPGVYRLVWRVTWANGKIRSFPNSGYVSWEIEP